MKKISFIFITLICITFMPVQAQPIVLDFVYDGLLTISSHPLTTDFMGKGQHMLENESPYIIGIKQGESGTTVVYEDWDGDGIDEPHTKGISADSMYFYNKEDFSLYKALQINDFSWISSVAKGIYTSDKNLTCFVAQVSSSCTGENCSGIFILDENGVQIAKLDIDNHVIKTEIVKVGNNYKLFVSCKEERTYVYSIGGSNDDAVSVNKASVSSSSVRKIAQDGQVLVQTETKTYTLTGSKIK